MVELEKEIDSLKAERGKSSGDEERFLMDSEGLDLGEERFLLDWDRLTPGFIHSRVMGMVFAIAWIVVLYVVVLSVIGSLIYFGFEKSFGFSFLIGAGVGIPVMVVVLWLILKKKV